MTLRHGAYSRAEWPENPPNVSRRSHQDDFPLKIFPRWLGNPSDSKSFLWVNHKLSLPVFSALVSQALGHTLFCNIFHSVDFDRAPPTCLLVMSLLRMRCFASLVLPKQFTLTSIIALRTFYSICLHRLFAPLDYELLQQKLLDPAQYRIPSRQIAKDASAHNLFYGKKVGLNLVRIESDWLKNARSSIRHLNPGFVTPDPGLFIWHWCL